jgi:hypothetical protein
MNPQASLKFLNLKLRWIASRPATDCQPLSSFSVAARWSAVSFSIMAASG